ncbi:MAG: site-determining protein [Candidatus Hydrogenedentota bacterium]
MSDQASNLREFIRDNKRGARVFAVTSGKGGVGKTSTSINLAIALAQRQSRVVVLDADLGLANVEVMLGLNSVYNLQHVITNERSMMDILVQGPGGIEIVPGSSGIARMVDLGPRARQNVLNGLRDLQAKTDFIIIDTMAGIGQNAVAFAAAADEVLLISTPEPSSIVDAYATAKTIFQLREDAFIRLIVNQAGSAQQAQAVADKLVAVAQQFLARKLHFLGWIPRDPHVQQGIMQSYPFYLRFPHAPASKALDEISERLHQQRPQTVDRQRAGGGFFRRIAENLGLAGNG